jgi:hypothetical protein
LSRDLFDLPVRCAPDVLRDAGFATRLYYGSDASFEKLDRFAQAHGLEIVDRKRLPPELPRGAWRGVTDAALFAAARAAGSGLQYNLLLTLSGHSPFDTPEDAPPWLAERVDEIAKGLPTARAEDRRRLATLAYTDHALAEWLEKSNAGRTVFIVSADHATADSTLWGPPDARSYATVPLFFYFPRDILTDEARAKIDALDRIAARTPVSLDDVPTMLLALLSRHGSMQKLPDERAWHTSGGGSARRATVWGIDASSRVFTVGREAPFAVAITAERSVPFSVWDAPLGPILRDATAALSAVVSARPCEPTSPRARP